MTKLSHIPMQIQKWIASLTHLFFLILGLTGICLMYIHGNFGLGLTGIGSVPYEDTAEFNTQFNSDLNDIFLYMDYQDVFGADSSIDLSRRDAQNDLWSKRDRKFLPVLPDFLSGIHGVPARRRL